MEAVNRATVKLLGYKAKSVLHINVGKNLVVSLVTKVSEVVTENKVRKTSTIVSAEKVIGSAKIEGFANCVKVCFPRLSISTEISKLTLVYNILCIS